jgi:transcriptional regulator with PAS, ATPase and Fis domain
MAFVVKYAPQLSLSAEALEVLGRHHWPGNVRELRNVIERACIFAEAAREIKEEHLLL